MKTGFVFVSDEAEAEGAGSEWRRQTELEEAERWKNLPETRRENQEEEEGRALDNLLQMKRLQKSLLKFIHHRKQLFTDKDVNVNVINLYKCSRICSLNQVRIKFYVSLG